MDRRAPLVRYAEGGDWRRLAPQLFDGGSWGNGASMRVAPVPPGWLERREPLPEPSSS